MLQNALQPMLPNKQYFSQCCQLNNILYVMASQSSAFQAMCTKWFTIFTKNAYFFCQLASTFLIHVENCSFFLSKEWRDGGTSLHINIFIYFLISWYHFNIPFMLPFCWLWMIEISSEGLRLELTYQWGVLHYIGGDM